MEKPARRLRQSLATRFSGRRVPDGQGLPGSQARVLRGLGFETCQPN